MLATPPEKSIVLIGAGNAHLVFLKKWRMAPVPGVSLTLINESATMPYSAMVPGFIANEYRREEIEVELPAFCRSAGVRFLRGTVAAIDTTGRTVKVSGRAYDFGYDLLSLNLGAKPSFETGEAKSVFHLRPIAALLDQLPLLDALITEGRHPKTIAVLGAGPSGCELALAFSVRYAAQKPAIHVFDRNERLVPKFSPRASRWFEERFSTQGIYFHSKTEPEFAGQNLIWREGNRLDFDAALLATSPEAPAILKTSGLKLDGSGFVMVGKSLASVSHAEVFSVGDCATLVDHPQLPKNGVYSVRMGESLYDNLTASLGGGPLRTFRPQRNYLALFNGGGGSGLLARDKVVLPGRWTRSLKNRIDLGWLSGFRASRMANGELESMRCTGCAAKVPYSVLQAALKRGEDREDCAITEMGGEAVTLSTVDFVPAFLDDPYLVGKIISVHCLSDIYAMNGTPLGALATLVLPWCSEKIQTQVFIEVMEGVREVCHAHGVTLQGGHSGEGERLSLGLTVTGEGKKGTLFLKRNLKPGDRLVLTKPLGSGTLLAAVAREVALAKEFEEGVHSMLVSNKLAAQILAKSGVLSATDVTGFGLVGHLTEMLTQSQVSATLYAGRIPALNSFERLSRLGIRSSLFPANSRAAASVVGDSSRYPVLFDPQTSGGLLAGVPSVQWERFAASAKEAGLNFWEVGTVTAGQGGQVILEN